MTTVVKQRSSNLELLRIISMVMIVLHHFCVHGIGLFQVCKNGDVNISEWGGVILTNSFVVIGVNLFILISGYFSVRLKWKSLVHLVLVMLFYKVFHWLLDQFVFGIPHPLSYYMADVLVISHPGRWWFVQVYIWLLMVSPILNRAFRTFSNRDSMLMLVILTILTVYFGWLWSGSFNTNGYTLFQFIYMYYLGYMIHRFQLQYLVSKSVCFIGYVITSILLAAFVCGLSVFLPEKAWQGFAYNSPFIIFSSVCVFCLFLKMDFSSKLVNRIAVSTLAVFLFHTGGELRNYLYAWVGGIYQASPLLHFCGYALVSIVLIFALTYCIDTVRIWILTPIERRMAQYCNDGFNRIMNRFHATDL